MNAKYLKRVTINVQHDTNNQEFFVPMTQGKISIKYEEEENTWKFMEVNVPQEARTFRIAPRLMEYALEMARYEKRNVLPACSYAKTYLASNPRFKKLLPK